MDLTYRKRETQLPAHHRLAENKQAAGLNRRIYHIFTLLSADYCVKVKEVKIIAVKNEQVTFASRPGSISDIRARLVMAFT